MSEIVENMAKAMWEKRRAKCVEEHGVDIGGWDEDDGEIPRANGIMEEAAAALATLRDPICKAIHCGCSNYCEIDDAEDTIRSLIDAALMPKD